MSVSIKSLEDLVAQSADRGDFNTALDQLLELFEKHDENPMISLYLGLVLVRMKNYQSGIRYLEQAKQAELDPGQKLRCLVFLGKAYADVKAFSKAERAFREALQTGVEEAGAYSALGAIFFERNMIDQAIDALQKALDIDPNYAGALNNMGFILCQSKKNIKDGVEYCKKAVDLDPKNPAYRDSYAMSLLVNGMYRDASDQIAIAEQLDPRNTVILAHKKEILKKMES
ncbi:MAG: tetratricopeptide repeat protein [Brevinema sp.]